MKKLFKDLLKPVLGIAAALGLAVTAEAQQPVTPKLYSVTNTTTFTIAGGSATVTTGATSNYNSVPFPIWRDRGFAFHIGVYAGGASGSNVEVKMEFATPHTNYAGAVVTNWENPIVFDFPNTGTAEKFFSTNVDKRVVDNYTLGRFSSLTNGHTGSLSVDPTNTFVSVIP